MNTPNLAAEALRHMNFRATEIEVPEDEPLRHDKLHRAEFVADASRLLLRLEGPFVLALDSPWGTGKTTLARMLQATLKQQGVRSTYFSAWQVDHMTDPLVPMVVALEKMAGNTPAMKKVKAVATTLAKQLAIGAVKMATLGGLDVDKEIEGLAAAASGDATKDIFAVFKKETQALVAFKRAVAKVVKEAASSQGGSARLVFFLDELDRCRPSFAIEVLERIKHLFNLPGLVFVLSVDRAQLEVSTGKVYGERIDAQEYLRRFIDLELRLPEPPMRAFVELQLANMKAGAFFALRSSYPKLKDDEPELAATLAALACDLGLSLRTVERAITRLALVFLNSEPNDFLNPPLLATLVVLRMKNPALYERFVRREASVQEVMAYLGGQRPTGEVAAGAVGTSIEAHLLLAHKGQAPAQAALHAYRQTAHSGHSSRASRLLRVYEEFERTNWASLEQIARKVDFATAGVSVPGP